MSDPAVGGFDLLAASIRADTGDLRTYLDVVADKLVNALPGAVRVEREGGLFAKEHRVRRVIVQLGARNYQLEWVAGDLVAAIGPEVVPLERWTQDLGNQIGERARTDAQARNAMSSLMEGRLPAQVLSRPDGTSILARHPADRFSPDSTVQVGGGDAAVLVVASQAKPALGPGSHRLGDSVDADPAADPSSAEIQGRPYFVGTGEHPNQRFGGAVDKVLDPQTQLAVGLRVFGEYVMKVADPVKLVETLGAQGTVSDQQIMDVLRDVVLKVLRSDLSAHISAQGWPVLGLAAHMDELESEALDRLREPAPAYGLAVVRFGNFTVTMKDEDEALLTEHHARPAATAPAGTTCPSCGHVNAAGSRFCSGCGKPLALKCQKCGTDNEPGGRFCSQCGAPLGESA